MGFAPERTYWIANEWYWRITENTTTLTLEDALRDFVVEARSIRPAPRFGDLAPTFDPGGPLRGLGHNAPPRRPKPAWPPDAGWAARSDRTGAAQPAKAPRAAGEDRRRAATQ